MGKSARRDWSAGREDAFEDDVVAVVERVAGHGVDEADVDAVRNVEFAEDVAAQQVLAHQGEAAAAGQRSRCSRVRAANLMGTVVICLSAFMRYQASC